VNKSSVFGQKNKMMEKNFVQNAEGRKSSSTFFLFIVFLNIFYDKYNFKGSKMSDNIRLEIEDSCDYFKLKINKLFTSVIILLF
jgi:hypothetical protein